MPYDYPTDEELEASTNKVMAWGAGLMLLFAAVFPLYRLYEPSGRDDAREVHTSSLVEQGNHLWGQNCAGCHGQSGEGGIAPALNSQQFLQAASDDQIRGLVAVGVPGTQMNAYSLDFGGSLTSEQIGAITTFIRSWEGDAPDVPEWRDPDGSEG